MADFSLQDDGFVAIEVNGATVQLDAYEAYNRVYQAADETDGQPVSAYLQKVADYMAELGYGRASHRLAERFANTLAGIVSDLKKKDEASSTPNSPASTEAPPSGAPVA